MADEELSDDVEAPDGEDFEDVPDEIDEDLVEDEAVDADDLDDDFVDDDDEEEEEAADAKKPKPTTTTVARTRRSGEDEEEEEDEDDVSDDDVEADLDTILKDRIAAQPDDEDDEDEAAPEPDDRSDGSGRIQPRRPGEFVCQSCFLVKHPSQLADPDLMLCTDCV